MPIRSRKFRRKSKIEKLIPKGFKHFYGRHFDQFFYRYRRELNDLWELPLKIILSPLALAYNIAGSAQRGFGVPEFISKLSSTAVFAVAALGTFDIAMDVGKKLLSQGDCQTCNGWNAMRCTICRGSGRAQRPVKHYALTRGDTTAESISAGIAEERAELAHHPPTLDPDSPLTLKDCPNCDGSGVMKCPECSDKSQIRLSADDLMEPPWKAYNMMRKMKYPYEHIVHSMKDPSIAAFWLITFPQVVGGFEYDDDIKKKIWWQYKESMRYDQLRDAVAKRKPGWEYLQEAMISIDPIRARDDPVIVKNVPYYNAKKALEAEVMKLDPPTRPQNWGELNLPLSASSWSKEDLKDPRKLYEMTVLLNAQEEIAEKILDSQWQTKWRQQKVNEMLEEKIQKYIQNAEDGNLHRSIATNSKERGKEGMDY